MSASARIRAGLVLCLLMAGTGRAGAFCRAHTCDPADPEQRCAIDKLTGCVATGQPLRWTSGCVSFAVQKDGSPRWGVDADAVMSASAAAFSAWLDADCGGKGPSLVVGSLGTVVCDQSRYNQHGKNANIIMFRDDKWPYPGSVDAFALTIVRFDADTGEIFDADIEVNSADFEITTDGAGVGADLQSLLTHEIGHFLGLAHTTVLDPEATMRTYWDGTGLGLRTLQPDDTAGICTVYPPSHPAASTCTPRHGFASECNVPVTEPDEGCGLVRPAPASGGFPALLLGALVTCAGGLRRRARGSSRRRAV